MPLTIDKHGNLPILVTNLDKLRVKKVKLRLITFSTNLCTMGKLYQTYDDCVQTNSLICNTMELPWRDNQEDISCIPAGEYRIKMTNSPKYGSCYKVFGVENRTDILIHKGNTTNDTKGCILPVSTFGILDTFKGNMFAGLSSGNAYIKLMYLLGGDNHTIEIVRY